MKYVNEIDLPECIVFLFYTKRINNMNKSDEILLVRVSCIEVWAKLMWRSSGVGFIYILFAF